MAQTALKGNPVQTNADLPTEGSQAKDFTLIAQDLSEANLEKYSGKKKIFNIVPSLDTPVCATSTRKFNEKAGSIDNTVVLVVSKDLPFAMKRFCATEGIENVEALSDFRGTFAIDYGVEMIDGPLKGLTARAIVVLDESDKVVHTELVADITQEPDYEKALGAVS